MWTYTLRARQVVSETTTRTTGTTRTTRRRTTTTQQHNNAQQHNNTKHIFKFFLRDASNSAFNERTEARALWVFRASQTFAYREREKRGERERARGKGKRVVKKKRERKSEQRRAEKEIEMRTSRDREERETDMKRETGETCEKRDKDEKKERKRKRQRCTSVTTGVSCGHNFFGINNLCNNFSLIFSYEMVLEIIFLYICNHFRGDGTPRHQIHFWQNPEWGHQQCPGALALMCEGRKSGYWDECDTLG